MIALLSAALALSGPAAGPPPDYPDCANPPAFYVYPASVRKIVDADTIDLDIDLGFRVMFENERFRLYGINAWEVRGKERPQGLAASAWFAKRLAAVETLTVISIRDTAGKYGRYLAVLCDGPDDINAEMVRAGHARWWDY